MVSFRALLLLTVTLGSAAAFTTQRPAMRSSVATATPTPTSKPTPTFLFRKNKEEDLSEIESRDMTRDEMRQLNAKNEDIMNAELIGMTVFSLILSVPMLYLVWVGFFSETSEINIDM
jgi:hypothetical protein